MVNACHCVELSVALSHLPQELSESTSAESVNTVDADNTGTMTALEEEKAQDLQVFQHIVKSIGDKDGTTLQVSQHAGIDEPLGLTLVTDKEPDDMCIKTGRKESHISFYRMWHQDQ